MSLRGVAQGMYVRPRGSHLTVDALAGATTIYVEDPTDFADELAVLRIDDVDLDYTSVTEDGAISLSDPLPADAEEGTWVYVVAGGQALDDYILRVSTDDEGDLVEVAIPFGERDLWPEVEEYDDPVPLTLSDDQERIEEVDGRTPERSSAFIRSPFAAGYTASAVSIPNGGEHKPGFAVEEDGVEWDFGTLEATILEEGMYDLYFPATFAGTSGTGTREAIIYVTNILGTFEVDSDRRQANATAKTTTKARAVMRLSPGAVVTFKVLQTSGAALDLLINETRFSIVKVAN